MGRSGRSFWNSSHELQVHRKGKWGGLVLARKLGKWVLFGQLGCTGRVNGGGLVLAGKAVKLLLGFGRIKIHGSTYFTEEWVAVEFVVETTLDCFGYLIFSLDQGKPLSPDRVFDFPMDEPESHPTYDFFAPGPLPGYAVEPMIGPLVGQIAEPMVEIEEQVIALVIDIEEDISMLFGDDDFGDDDSSFTILASRFLVPSSRIEDLSTRMSNLEYRHGHIVKKVIQMVQAVDRLEQRDSQIQQLQTMLSEMSSRESTLMQSILRMDRRLADLERIPQGP
nr:hypothetical protein [Tanacetum cinerariifolium]